MTSSRVINGFAEYKVTYFMLIYFYDIYLLLLKYHKQETGNIYFLRVKTPANLIYKFQ